MGTGYLVARQFDDADPTTTTSEAVSASPRCGEPVTPRSAVASTQQFRRSPPDGLVAADGRIVALWIRDLSCACRVGGGVRMTDDKRGRNRPAIPTILVVDDSCGGRHLICGALVAAGYRVRRGGGRLRRAGSCRSDRPDLVLLAGRHARHGRSRHTARDCGRTPTSTRCPYFSSRRVRATLT
jgi:hypothetical protein